MLWIGLTGGMGSGKSTVGQMIREAGYPVVDADEMAKLAVSLGSAGLAEIVATFGRKSVNAEGELDRKALGKIVFNDREKLARLEAIIHPRVKELVDKQRAQLVREGHGVAFYDVPLLYEKGMEKGFDAVIVVSTTVENQVERSMRRDGLSREDVLTRLAAQIPLSEKSRRADYVIPNLGDHEALRKKVSETLSLILR